MRYRQTFRLHALLTQAVHIRHNDIGRGGRTLVDGPGAQWVDEDMSSVYVYNRGFFT